jgi:hypothetical protein
MDDFFHWKNTKRSEQDIAGLLLWCIISTLAIFQESQKTTFFRKHFDDRIDTWQKCQ